jgi:hypothetical protein
MVTLVGHTFFHADPHGLISICKGCGSGLSAISGVGETKLARYGEQILAELA